MDAGPSSDGKAGPEGNVFDENVKASAANSKTPITCSSNQPEVHLRKFNSMLIKTDDHRFRTNVEELERLTFLGQLKTTIFSSWLNILFPAIIVGFIVKYLNLSPAVTFSVNFVAILPLGNMLHIVTEELTIRAGYRKGLIVIVTFGLAIFSAKRCYHVLIGDDCEQKCYSTCCDDHSSVK